MIFAKRKGQPDPEMIRIEEQCRLYEEATNCQKCADNGVVVEMVLYQWRPDTSQIEYRRCECGAPVHPNLKKYISRDLPSGRWRQ